jgi:hypothetical protein
VRLQKELSDAIEVEAPECAAWPIPGERVPAHA